LATFRTDARGSRRRQDKYGEILALIQAVVESNLVANVKKVYRNSIYQRCVPPFAGSRDRRFLDIESPLGYARLNATAGGRDPGYRRDGRLHSVDPVSIQSIGCVRQAMRWPTRKNGADCLFQDQDTAQSRYQAKRSRNSAPALSRCQLNVTLLISIAEGFQLSELRPEFQGLEETSRIKFSARFQCGEVPLAVVSIRRFTKTWTRINARLLRTDPGSRYDTTNPDQQFWKTPQCIQPRLRFRGASGR